MSNLGWPVRIVESGGIPVTEAANGLGAPYVEAENGVAVTFVESGGYPLSTGNSSGNSSGIPFSIVINSVLCERVSIDGVWATIDGQPVYMEV